jgi:hypothetical protein
MGENDIKVRCFCVQCREMVAHLDIMGKKVGTLKGTDNRNGCALLQAHRSAGMCILRHTHASHTPFKYPAKTGECHLKRDQVYD